MKKITGKLAIASVALAVLLGSGFVIPTAEAGIGDPCPRGRHRTVAMYVHIYGTVESLQDELNEQFDLWGTPGYDEARVNEIERELIELNNDFLWIAGCRNRMLDHSTGGGTYTGDI